MPCCGDLRTLPDPRPHAIQAGALGAPGGTYYFTSYFVTSACAASTIVNRRLYMDYDEDDGTGIDDDLHFAGYEHQFTNYLDPTP